MGNEWIWLVVIAIILLFGARKIPDLAKGIGRARGEFEKGKQEAEVELRKEREKNREKSQREKMEEAAKPLGIDFEKMNDEELREALKKAIEKQTS
jgi:sec-independent protein translocase protein TatA